MYFDDVVDLFDTSSLIDVYDETAILLYSFGWNNKLICNEMGITLERLYKLLDHYEVQKKKG